MSHVVIEPYSAGYDLVQNTTVHTIPDSEAIMDFKLYETLKEQFGEPIVGYVGGLHYYFKSAQSIPELSLAVPEGNHDEPETFLIQK